MAATIERFVAAQKAGKRARPPAAMPTFGYEQDAFLARPAIAAYCAHFGVAPERARVTGA